MNKLKKAIKEKDYLKAKRLIIDNPKYLEENVDCVLDMIKVLSEPIRFVDEPLSEEKKDELYRRMKEEMKKGKRYGEDLSFLNYHWQRASTWHDKERAHEEAISENKFKYDQAPHETDKAFAAVCIDYFHEIDGIDSVEFFYDHQDFFYIRFTLNKYSGKSIVDNFVARHSGEWIVKVYNPSVSIKSSGEYKEDYLIEFTKKAKRDGQ